LDSTVFAVFQSVSFQFGVFYSAKQAKSSVKLRLDQSELFF